jgi:hypothetical protein
MNNSIRLLQEYRDKCYVYNVMCEMSSSYYSNIKSFINIPLILSTSALTICNASSFRAEDMQIPNICINACTALLISFINNFKLAEKCSNFRSLALKYMQLLHHIEDKLNSEGDKIDAEDFRDIVKLYDDLASQNEYAVPTHIKTKVKKIYHCKRFLPNILNCEQDFVLKETKIEGNIVL